MICTRIIMGILTLCQIHSSYEQDCPSKQELQNSLRQVQKLLSAHESSYLQSLRSLRKKLEVLQNNVLRSTGQPSNGGHLQQSADSGTCPKLESPENGRKLGRVQAVGHEVHFLCNSGYELVGSESRLCQEALSWSGQQPFCRNINECSSTPCQNGGTCVDDVNRFVCVCARGWTGSTCQTSTYSILNTVTNTSGSITPSSSSPEPPPSSAFIKPSRCTQLQDSTHCTCEAGFTISGRDNSFCTDIDECELFHSGQAGRLCLHTCINTPGSYRCTCPAGYDVVPDSRSCKDVDECANRQHNCSRDQTCVNTHGGFQCVHIDCPRIRNATYAKISATRCERNPCQVENKACAQAPNSVSFHYLSLMSNLPAPRVLFRVSATRVLGDSLRFSLRGGRDQRHFTVQRSDRKTGQLVLVSPVQGPAMLEAEVEMIELERRTVLARYITKVILFVSPYDF